MTEFANSSGWAAGHQTDTHSITLLRKAWASVSARFQALPPVSPLLWFPLSLMGGIWVYFSLRFEPSNQLAIATFAVGLLALFWAKRRFWMVMLASVLLGFGLAKLRVDWVATPELHFAMGRAQVTGIVEDVDQRGEGRSVIILHPEVIEGMEDEALPKRLRLASTESFGPVEIGERISFPASLSPVFTPVKPGGFDYGRYLYFSSIGGMGRVSGPITFEGDNGAWRLHFNRAINQLRSAIDARVTAVLPGDIGAISSAMIDGERAAISKQANASLQASGLAHILSISGLHMVLVAGGVFYVVRALLALNQNLALRYPIKKWAAIAALFVGMFYTLLAGPAAATQRSFIMIAVVFFAVLVNRSGLSLRNLALAAILLLVTQPECAVDASFQMSFLAVMGLAALSELIARPKEQGAARVGRLKCFPKWITKLVLLSLLTSLVAGGFSSISAVYHFGRLSPYSLLANALAMPVMSIIVMPMAMVAVAAMPLGLEHWPLQIMGWGMNLVMVISDQVAALPGASEGLSNFPAAAAVALALCACCLCLLQGALRWVALVPATVAVLLFSTRTAPDLLIDSTAATVALRTATGELAFADGRGNSFSAAQWLRDNGETEAWAEARARTGWQCQNKLCSAVINGWFVLYALKGRPLQEEDCVAADILISAEPLGSRCTFVPLRIDRFSVWRAGAHSVQMAASGVEVFTALGLRGDRPWVAGPRSRNIRNRKTVSPDRNTDDSSAASPTIIPTAD